MTKDVDIKARLLELLDTVSRKVTTGEVTGLVIFGLSKKDSFSSWRRGDPPGPSAVLLMQDYADDAKRIYWRSQVEEGTADQPMIGLSRRAVEPEEES